MAPMRFFFLFTILSLLNLILVQSDNYIVHMDISAMPKSFSDHHTWYANTLSSISTDDSTTSTTSNPNLLYSYTHAMHGFSASLSDSQLASLENTPGFISWTRDEHLMLHTTCTPDFLGLNSNFGAWPESGYGKNVIIGVVDTGVSPESKSYEDHGMSDIPSRWKGKCVDDISFKSSMCNKKLIGARFFNKGMIANKPEVTISVNSTRDIEGHGTHTSAIAAGNFVKGASFFEYANGTARGMAPYAHLAIYKTSWQGRSYASDVIAAVDQAIDDGVDVLTLSMSWEGIDLDKDPIAIASFAAMEKGIFVAASAGNEGPGYYTIGNGAPWVITVGAGTIDRAPSGVITLGNGVSITGTALYPDYSFIAAVPLVFLNGCNHYDELKNVGVSIVVCLGTDYEILDQIFTVKHAQQPMGIFISETSHIEQLIPTEYPAIFVNPKQGEQIRNYINRTKEPTASLYFHRTQIGIKPAPIVGDYSSKGPALTNPTVMKPDIIAPGTLVLSSWPKTTPVIHRGSDTTFSPFNLLYGTSMACPHVAGVAALLKSVYPNWSPAAIRSAMMTTADSLDNSHSPIKVYGDFLVPANPLAMGAGHINPNKALNPGLVYDTSAKDYIRFLCSMNYTKNQITTVTRSSNVDCSNASADLNYPSFIAFFNASIPAPKGKITQKFPRTVTNVGEGMSTYTAKLTHIDEVEVSVVPDTLVFKNKYQKLSFTLIIKGPTRLYNQVVYSSLSWVDVGGKHVVRSPIVATRINWEEIQD